MEQITTFATSTADVFTWQIPLTFVILGLIVATIALYAALPIAEQINKLQKQAQHIYIGWQLVAGCVLGASFWATHILLMLGIKLPTPALNLNIILTLLICFANYFLLFRLIGRDHISLTDKILWTTFNTLTLYGIHIVNILPMIEVYAFEVHAYAVVGSLILLIASSILTFNVFHSPNSDIINNTKSTLLSILIATLIIISYRLHIGGIDLYISPIFLTEQQESEKLITALIISIALLLMTFLVFLAIFAHAKILEQATDLEKTHSMMNQLNNDQSSLEQLAHYDTLTALYNRHTFMNAFAARLNESRQAANKLAILFIDLDNFKKINDTMGHATGDELLRIFSRRLRSILRGHDLIGRIGGDEFCLVTPISSTAEAKVIATRILHKMQEPITISGQVTTTTISIGISLFPYDGDTQDQLIKHADTALYQSKGSGRNTLNFYSDYLQHKSHREISIQKDLHSAITQSQLFLDYQPVVRLSDKKIVALEALVRWQHPEKGVLTPEHFINIAEFNGFVELVDMWVIRNICRDIKTLIANNSPLKISMNCSSLNINNDRFIPDAVAILEEEKVDKQWFSFELLESVLYEHRHKAPVFLSKLSQSGIKLIIDDFGSSSSSLLWLKTLPVSELKLDRCLLLDAHNPNDADIVAALIAMSHKLGWHITAKGVELQEQITLLTNEQCDYAQGYAFGKPMRFEEIIELLA